MSPTQQLTEVIRAWSEWSMHRSMRDFKRFIGDTGLSFSHVSILMRLYHHGDKGGISEMGEHLGVTIAAASQAVDQLVQRGLIERSEALADRRVKRLALTAKGKALIEQGFAVRSGWMESLAHALSPEQQEQVIAALVLLTEAAQRTEE
jgi:DNA-binding MarR family transcriptional regulator